MSPKRKTSLIIAVLCGATLAAVSAAEDRKGDPYPLGFCPVSGERLGSMGSPLIKTYAGREIRFCCAGCTAAFEADKAKHLKKIDEEIIKQQAAQYPLDICVATGAKLDASAVECVIGNRLFRVCSEGCKAEVEKDLAKYLDILDKAVVAKQKDAYPLDVCVVSGQKLGSMGEPVNYVIGTRLVRFCCSGCIASFEKDPAKYLSALDAAPKPAAASAETR
ncbi:MAG TPA: hypothetical protein PLO62_14950 [Candidatus Hydrogenedentes bacterium]|nr:hypothetical protein [Candidatus Hydrogenedentota bacterium]HOS01566.1 hypothetical protein [Candidatus Hydrogenedentota bacterium]